MNSLVRASNSKMPALAPAPLIINTLKNLPLLLAVQLIANPCVTITLLLTLTQLNPAIKLLLWSDQHFPIELIILPLYWAFLAGGANRINLALARNQPANLSMLLTRRRLVRKYLGAVMIAAMTANVCCGVSTMLAACFAWLNPLGLEWIIAAAISLTPIIVLLAKSGFLDLSIVDKEHDSFQALNHSLQMTVGHFKVLFLFYLFLLLPTSYVLLAAAFDKTLLIPAYFFALTALTIGNFWRAKLYCIITDREKSIEQIEQIEQLSAPSEGSGVL